MWAVIGTWRMSMEAIEKTTNNPINNEDSRMMVEKIIREIEDFPYFKSVGFGGLPNEEMEVELDAGFMDGSTFDVGAIAALKDFKNPISIAKELSKKNENSFLVGEGAEKFAHKEGFERKNMLTERAKIHYKNRKKIEQIEKKRELKAYAGHDTVGVVALDMNNNISVGTSTSGLFMKNKGRVGDSPIVGSGFYADSDIGAATATGLGEDLMKGVISYEIVRLIEDGLSPQQACEKAVFSLEKKLLKKGRKVGDLSVVALNKKGEFGVASTLDGFSFVYMSEKAPLSVYVTHREGDKTVYELASKEWLDDYMKKRMAKLELL